AADLTDAPQWAVCGLPSEVHPRQPLLGRGSEINQFIEAILEVFSIKDSCTERLRRPAIDHHADVCMVVRQIQNVLSCKYRGQFSFEDGRISRSNSEDDEIANISENRSKQGTINRFEVLYPHG